MFYLIPTKRGIGVELWGTIDDLRVLYDTVAKFWEQEELSTMHGSKNRDFLMSGFSYEIRKAYSGQRLKRELGHYSYEPLPHYGCQFSWPHILFSLTVIRTNMRFVESNRYDLGVFLQLEHELQKCMMEFDGQGAIGLQHFISGAIYGDNEYLYHYMRSINADFIALGGGKTAFRQLSKLMKKASFGSQEYDNYRTFLLTQAHINKCEVDDLELSDDHIDYENIKW